MTSFLPLLSLTTVYIQVSLSSCLQYVSWNNTPLDYSVRVIYPHVPNGTNLSCILQRQITKNTDRVVSGFILTKVLLSDLEFVIEL